MGLQMHSTITLIERSAISFRVRVRVAVALQCTRDPTSDIQHQPAGMLFLWYIHHY
jgi:hypothetical protein